MLAQSSKHGTRQQASLCVLAPLRLVHSRHLLPSSNSLVPDIYLPVDDLLLSGERCYTSCMSSHSSEHTLVSLWAERIAQDGPRTAMLVKTAGQFQSRCWNDIALDVSRTAVALINLGVEPGDRVVQLAENSYQWIVCDLAIQLARGVHVPIHAPLTGQQAAYQIADSGSQVVLISAAQQAEKLASCSDLLPPHVQYLSFEPCAIKIGSDAVKELAEMVDSVDENQASEVLQQAVKETTPDRLATILYTSGTTGEPKGVLLNQRNLTSNAQAALESFGQMGNDLRLTFLPLSHIFARTCDLYTWIISGARLALADSRETVLADCAAIAPTLLNGVPYFFDKLYRYLSQQGDSKKSGALRELLGGKMRICCSGGAALPDHLFDFYQQQEILLLQGYGLTETSPVITASSPTRNRRGSAGPAISGVELRIADDGEILTRGPHVMVGYYKNQQATDEVIRAGWLYTGDLGRIDEAGFLYITGRKKEILVTSGGKNIAPVMLESLLGEDPLIAQAMVIGDGRNYLTALIVPELDMLQAEMVKNNLTTLVGESLFELSSVLELFQQRIEQRLNKVSHYEQVRKFTLLQHPFSIERGELTPKLSLRRAAIYEHYSEEIETMYRR